jgi:uncharacterized OB-fold protein
MQRYRLQGARCSACETVMFPPRAVCPTGRSAHTLLDEASRAETLAGTFEVISVITNPREPAWMRR